MSAVGTTSWMLIEEARSPFFAICAGMLSLLLFVIPIVYSPRAPVELLPFFVSHRSSYILLAIAILIWVIVAIPFVVAVGAILSARSRSVAVAATLLSAGGILLLGFAVLAFVGAFLAIVASAGAAPMTAAATKRRRLCWGTCRFTYAGDVSDKPARRDPDWRLWCVGGCHGRYVAPA